MITGFLTTWFNIMFGARLRDMPSGMYAVDLEFQRGILWERGGISVESEPVAHMASAGRIGEVDIGYRRRLGKKKLGVRDGFKIALDMIRLTTSYNPVFTLFMVASTILIPGRALETYTTYTT